jgi:hypothetical protein
MGWRGALRAMAAAQRAAERDAVRRHRQYERIAKEQAKVEALRAAALEVEEHENWIERITSVHRDCGTTWRWQSIAKAPPPRAPKASFKRETEAQKALEKYSPNWFDRLLRLEMRRRAKLAAAVEAGRATDSAENDAAQADFESKYRDWSEMRELAEKILANDPVAFRDAVDELSPFQELTDLGSRLDFEFHADRVATATLVVNSDAVIPTESKALLQSGKLSVKKMPAARFYELYQDYVVGAALRIARELFALLPLDAVVVTAVANMLNTGTGHMENQAILSVAMPRRTLERLNFESLDPSDGLRNFNYRMDFKKTKGFAVVTPLGRDSLGMND